MAVKKQSPADQTIMHNTLIKPKEEFRAEIFKRIEEGKGILKREIKTLEELDDFANQYGKWNHYNTEFLQSAFYSHNNKYSKQYEQYTAGLSRLIGGGHFQHTNPHEEKLKRIRQSLEVKIERLQRLESTIELLRHTSSLEPFPEAADRKAIAPSPRIHISGSNNVVNLGGIENSILSATQQLSRSGSEEVAEAFRQFAKAISQSETLSNDQKEEAMEHVQLLAEQAASGVTPKKGLIRTSIDALRGVLPSLGQLASFTGQNLTKIIGHFQVLHNMF